MTIPPAPTRQRCRWRGWLSAAPRLWTRAVGVAMVCGLAAFNAPGQAGAGASPADLTATDHFEVRAYRIEGSLALPGKLAAEALDRHLGPRLSLADIARAAVDLQAVYRAQGHPNTGIVIAPQRIADGVVPLTVFEGAFPQIVVGGRRYFEPARNGELAAFYPASLTNALAALKPARPAPAPVVPAPPVRALPVTPATPREIALAREQLLRVLRQPVAPAVPAPPARVLPVAPATPREIALARQQLVRDLRQLAAAAADTRVHVVSTNTGPRFRVEHYEILGNSVLPPAVLARALTNIDGDFGTNVSLDGVRAAVAGLQQAYTDRGYLSSVSVGLPQQQLTNATVKVEVTEGRLAAIEVEGNRYFSSNNVLRALPGLHTNQVLNDRIFQAQLNLANASQDRQIYPVLLPGPYPGSSVLKLKVVDDFPLHAKVEYNNESSPGTPDLRVNSSAAYDNLWDLNQSLGLQYSFSPGFYKTGSQWNAYDVPLVANYGGFYRIPLGSPEVVQDEVANQPGVFGYDEATRKFNLPPAAGEPELNLIASRSTIDTGLNTVSSSSLVNIPGVLSINQNNVQEDLTVNNDVGFRLSRPLQLSGDFHSTVSGGLDFKTYQITSFKTNNFLFAAITLDPQGHPNPPVYSTVASPVPETDHQVAYLPIALDYSGVWHEGVSTVNFGLGASINPWYTGSLSNLQAAVGSARASGHWVALTPRFSWQAPLLGDWTTSVRADGQWADQPLLSTEQFGAGGVNSVRGYHEGEVFGDTGWHVSLEEQSPVHLIGNAWAGAPLTVQGTVYMDYARVYLLDPQGAPPGTSLWGAGIGGIFSLGTHFDARFLFSLPMIQTEYTPAYQPYFNFDLSAHF